MIKHWCKVRFKDDNPFSSKYEVTFSPSTTEECSSLFNGLFGNMGRFLFVEIEDVCRPCNTGYGEQNLAKCFLSQFSNQFWGPMELFKEGILFSGKRYYFFGGELGRIRNRKEKEFGQSSTISAWFFAESDPTCPRYPSISVCAARRLLGSLDTLPASKANARLKLGFSSIYDQMKVRADCIYVIPDIEGSSDHVLTDGCGFISHTLVRELPYGIHQGQLTKARESTMTLPAVLQVRCACLHGLFKGCLLVSFDESICPKDSVIFRDSMRKVGVDSTPFQAVAEEVVVGVVSTFEHPELLEAVKKQRRDMSDHHIRLNRSLCLLLSHLQVPYDWFEGIMDEETLKVKKAVDDPKHAYFLVRQSLFDREDDQKNEASSDHPDDSSFMASDMYYSDEDYKLYKPKRPAKLSIAEQARDFLLSGHDLSEPYLRLILRKLQFQKLTRLQKCNLPVRRAIYLVGAPDPYGFLAPHEVFVCLPRDSEEDLKRPLAQDQDYIKGSVVVSRHPMYHPGDVRKLMAVYHYKLAEQLQNTSGGVIFFSTQGERSPADLMSGGDYDGDQFVVIYNATLVDMVSEVKACDEPGESKCRPVRQDDPAIKSCSEPDCRLCVDHAGWSMFRRLLLDCQSHTVGRYSNAWLAWADRFSPAHSKALACAELVNLALDSSKTGAVVPRRSDLLRYLIPHYMGPELGAAAVFEDELSHNDSGNSTSHAKSRLFQSCSVLGKLHDKVIDPIGEALEHKVCILCDFSLLYVQDHEDWNPPVGLLRYHVMEDCCSKLFTWLPLYEKDMVFWLRIVSEFRRRTASVLGSGESGTTSSSEDPLHALKERERALFLSKSKEFSEQHGIKESVACSRVAGFVYLATYFSALQHQEKSANIDKARFSLSYCWEICGEYLHENKRNASKLLNRQPQTDALPKEVVRMVFHK